MRLQTKPVIQPPTTLTVSQVQRRWSKHQGTQHSGGKWSFGRLHLHKLSFERVITVFFGIVAGLQCFKTGMQGGGENQVVVIYATNGSNFSPGNASTFPPLSPDVLRSLKAPTAVETQEKPAEASWWEWLGNSTPVRATKEVAAGPVDFWSTFFKANGIYKVGFDIVHAEMNGLKDLFFFVMTNLRPGNPNLAPAANYPFSAAAAAAAHSPFTPGPQQMGAGMTKQLQQPPPSTGGILSMLAGMWLMYRQMRN